MMLSLIGLVMASGLAIWLGRLVGLKYAGLLLALLCDASFIWASVRCFRRGAGGLLVAQRRALIGSYATAVLHVLAILYANHGSFYHYAAGASLYVLGLMLFWSTVAATSDQSLDLFFSGEVPNTLLEHGPYRAIRHPFYTAYILVWVAGAIMTYQAWLLPTVALNIVLYMWAARQEEAGFQLTPFAERHRGYCRRVGMFWPRLAPIMLPDRVRPLDAAPLNDC